MRISKKNIRTLALAMSIATIATSLPNNMVHAKSETLDKAKLQSNELEIGTYFSKKPKIGDIELHINTKKLMDDNKLAIGNRLKMKLIIGNEQPKIKTLVNSVTNENIKEDYTSVQVMGLVGSSIMLFREFTAGDRIELYVVKGEQETRVGNITVEGERSLDPIVEQTKDKIMLSSKMIGSIQMFVKTKSDNTWKNFIFDKPNTANAISYDFPMERLQSKYGANFGDEFVVVHKENGKGKSISKKMRLKYTYDAPKVDFKERKDTNDLAGFTISIPDNKNLEPTPIQNNFPKLKIVKGNEEKTYTINKSSLNKELTNEELTLVDGGLFYSIPKTTPNKTKFVFSQVGDNFNPSEAVTKTYEVDMTKASPLYEELEAYPDEKKEKFKETIENIKNNLEKEDRTQKEVDDAANALATIILPNLRDKLGSKRQEATKTIENLKNLDEKTKQIYKGKVTHAHTEDQINDIVQEAMKKDSEIDKAKILEGQRKEALNKIKKLTNLPKEKLAQAEEELKKAIDKAEIDKIVSKYEEESKKISQEKMLEDEKNNYIKKLDDLTYLTKEDKSKFKKDIQEATTMDALQEAYNSGVEINLSKAKVAALEKVTKLEELSESEKESAINEIKVVRKISEITPIVDKYTKISEERSRTKRYRSCKKSCNRGNRKAF